LRKAIELSDKVGGTQSGQSLVARKGTFLPEDSMGSFFIDKEKAQGYPLTENQIKTESEKYKELKKAKDNLEDALRIEQEKNAVLVAEKGLEKAKSETKRASKKTHEERVQERKNAVQAAKDAIKKLYSKDSGNSNEIKIQKNAIPGIEELQAIAPHVKTLLESYIGEGIDKLDNLVTKIHSDLKEVLPDISKKSVMDFIAGEYNEKRATKSEKNSELRLLKREAELLNNIQKARLGEEKATSEKNKGEQSRRIEDLKKKLEDVRRINKERKLDEPVDDKTAADPEHNKELQKKLTKRINELQDDLKNRKFAEEKPIPKPFVLSQKTQQLKDKVIQLEKKISEERFLDERSKMSKWGKAWDNFQNIAGVRRLIQTSVDASIWFRQLGSLALNPRKWVIVKKFIGAGVNSVFSQKNYDRYMDAIHKSPDFKQSLEDGIRYNELNAIHPNQQNEFFPRSFIYKIPIAKQIIEASQRLADSSLNVARYELYNKYKRALLKEGITRESDPKVYEEMAKLVMNSTGSGNLLKALENRQAEKLLSATFYGARLMAANFNTLNPLYYAKMPKEVRREAMKDFASYTTTLLAVTLGLAAAGGKVSLDPDDSDFLKVRFGDKVYDLTGGKAAYIRTFMRWVEAGYARATKSNFEANKALSFAGKSTVDFFRYKLAPNTSYGVNALYGKDALGRDFDWKDIYQDALPLYADDAWSAIKDEGVTGFLTVVLPNLLGVGYGNYYSEPKMKPIEETLERNLNSDEMNKDLIKNYKDKGRSINNKEFSEFIEKRDDEIERLVRKLYEGTTKENKQIDGNTGEIVNKKYSEMSKQEIISAISSIKKRATVKVKKDLFGEKEETNQQKVFNKRLKEVRKSIE